MQHITKDSCARYKAAPEKLFPCLAASFEADFKELINFDLQRADPHSELFSREHYCGAALLSKLPKSATSASDRRTKAIEKFIASDDRLGDVNIDLLFFDEKEGYVAFARSLIKDLLGPVNDDWLDYVSFSGGASTSKTRLSSSTHNKFRVKSDITVDAVKHLLRSLPDSSPGRSMLTSMHGDQFYNLVEGNVLFTVPKNADIDRAAAKEPDWNMFLQKGVGSFIRNRLKKVGVYLEDQGFNNFWSCEGSKTGSHATLDLRSASDSISISLVHLLLPSDWAVLLDDLRSKYMDIDGSRRELNMFSSMGNGFTFELESLIFWALAKSVTTICSTRSDIPTVNNYGWNLCTVYGDDIIVPTFAASTLTNTLVSLGFLVNTEKSFVTGSFRESCGGHWFKGKDVKPFYIRKPIDRISRVIWLLNTLRRWSVIESLGICDPRFLPLWRKYRDFVPPHLWGGVQASSSSSLVTSHSRRYILSPRVLTSEVKDWASYADSLNRLSPSGETVIETGLFSVRMNKQHIEGDLYFWFENERKY
uniref:RNA-directed RNA polymerase n=1 Tax=Shahe levi-like virus 2 TaxID=1923427 RepID=A0A1L3KIP4_9VIRU|nr:hypothetical protein [Shahe levi-like virus 2]